MSTPTTLDIEAEIVTENKRASKNKNTFTPPPSLSPPPPTPNLAPTPPLSPEEQEIQDFKELQEGRINNGFFEMVDALYEIKHYKDGVIYDKKNGGTFEEYVKAQFNFNKQHFYRLTNAGEFLRSLKSEGVSILPARESQVRPILQLPEDKRVEFWKQQITGKKEAEVKKIPASVIMPAVKTFAKGKGIAILKRPRASKSASPDSAKQQCRVLLKRLEKVSAGLPQAVKIKDFLDGIDLLLN